MFNRSFILLWLGSLSFMASFQILLTAMPIYAQRLGAHESEIGLLLGAFAGAATFARPPIGWLLDRWRKVPILVAGAAIFALSSAGYALVEPTAALLLISPIALLLGLRAFHGVGMSVYSTAGQTLVVDAAPASQRGTALGLYGIAANLAVGVGPAAGMAIAMAFGFSILFAGSAAVAILAILLSVLVTEPARSPARRRPARLFNAAVLSPGIAILTLMFAYGAMASFLPLYALQRGMANPGLFFTVYAGAMLGAQVLAGWASDRYGRLAAVLPGLVLGSAGMVAISLSESWWFLVAGAIYGASMGAAWPALFAWAGDLVPAEQRGSAMATMGFFLEIGISSGAIFAGLLAGPLGLGATFIACAAIPLLGLLPAFGSRPPRKVSLQS